MEHLEVINIKTCSKCGYIKKLFDFGLDTKQRDGHKKVCKLCRSVSEKSYRDKDIEEFRKKRAIYRQNNREAIRAIGRIANRKYSKAHKDKRQAYVMKNKDHIKQYKNKYFQDNKEKVMNKFYLRKYGISLEDKLEMLRKQKYACEICSIELLNSRVSFVDHDHKTGKVRGLLCNTCNRALGMFGDNVGTLESAKNYLTRYK